MTETANIWEYKVGVNAIIALACSDVTFAEIYCEYGTLLLLFIGLIWTVETHIIPWLKMVMNTKLAALS